MHECDLCIPTRDVGAEEADRVDGRGAVPEFERVVPRSPSESTTPVEAVAADGATRSFGASGVRVGMSALKWGNPTCASACVIGPQPSNRSASPAFCPDAPGLASVVIGAAGVDIVGLRPLE